MTNDVVLTFDDPKTCFAPGKQFTPAPTESARTPLATVRSHYRSKIYTAAYGTNPLTAAASGLLTLMSKLRTCPHYDSIENLYFNLIHEIKAFESQAQRLNYRTETILIARYVLATSLDETILATSWGKESAWNNHKLLSYFQQEDWGGDRFFVILERLTEEASQHTDLLELMYFCLNLGYEGKYRFQDRGHITLDLITENLFRKIKQCRQEIKPELALPAPEHQQQTSVKLSFLPLKLFVISSVMSVLLLHVGINGFSAWNNQAFSRDFSMTTAYQDFIAK